MPKEKEMKNIRENIMSQIKEGKIKMKPKAYFIVGSVLTFVGLVASIATSVFAFGLINFFLRSNGRMFGRNRMEYIYSIIPWWLPLVAIGGLILGLVLIKRYDFSYKIGIKKAVIVAILAIVVAGWLIDSLGLNDLFMRRGWLRHNNNPTLLELGF